MSLNWNALLRGELWLVFDVALGLLLGEAILRWGAARRLMIRLEPFLKRQGAGGTLTLALALSIGSAKAGAALLASALKQKEIERDTALWGTLLLAFPAYLHRWPATMALSVSLAGGTGAVFAAIILLRSALRFLLILQVLKRKGAGGGRNSVISFSETPLRGFIPRTLKTLPWACAFYALAFVLIPRLEELFRNSFAFLAFLPLAGVAVAAASTAHLSAALALAGGSLAAGELTTAQALFALLLGNGLSMVTRSLRQNSGYYFGLFPGNLARSLLLWNVGTQLPFVLLTLALAALPLCL